MNKLKVGQKVKVLGPSGHGSAGYPPVGYVGTVKSVPNLTGPTTYNKYYYLEGWGCPFVEPELVAAESSSPAPVPNDKVDAFRKAVELVPDALLEDQITLAEWLMK